MNCRNGFVDYKNEEALEMTKTIVQPTDFREKVTSLKVSQKLRGYEFPM